jgi:excisionase family DNA binding protein
MDAVRDAGMDDRLTVAEAADRLGITKEAVRKRIHRGTLHADKAADGTVMVYVPPSGTPGGTPSSPERDLLYEEMRERISYLERQVEEEREARRRADTLLARLMDRVPELEPPREQAASQERPGGPESVFEDPERAEPRPATGDAQEGAEPRSWWRRMFGV